MIHIITDSTSDISKEIAKELKIHILSLPVYFGNEVFKEISNEAFYEKLAAAEKLPTTSQVNPGEFQNLFEALLQSEEDEIIGIFISSALSGTFQSAAIAKTSLDNTHIHLVDSRNATFGLALLVYEANRLKGLHYAAEEIVKEIERLVPKVKVYALVDTLKYLRMGGRISSATAFVGGVLGVNPLISIVDGKVESVGKVRGRKNGFRWIKQQMTKDKPNFSRAAAFGHTNDKEALRQCMDYFKEYASFCDIYYDDIGAVIGTHAGPGAVGIAYFQE